MSRLICAALVAVMVVVPASAQHEVNDSTVSLDITVTGILNDAGVLWILVFDDPEGFPTDVRSARIHEAIPITGTSVKHVIGDLQPGKYAVSVIHDADDDGHMDRNELGTRTEAYGVANDKPRVGMPKFRKVVFEARGGTEELTVTLRY